MISHVEHSTARALRELLAGLPPGSECEHSPGCQDFLSGLEYFMPEVLAAQCDDWPPGLRLDGILPAFCRKTGERRVEVLGMAILLVHHDQRSTPVHAHLRLSSGADRLERFDFRLGERDGDGGLCTYPFHASLPAHEITWAYRATRSQRPAQ